MVKDEKEVQRNNLEIINFLRKVIISKEKKFEADEIICTTGQVAVDTTTNQKEDKHNV